MLKENLGHPKEAASSTPTLRTLLDALDEWVVAQDANVSLLRFSYLTPGGYRVSLEIKRDAEPSEGDET